MIPVTGKLVFGFHCFIVKTGRHTILIDSCIGNDKERPTRPQFHRLRTPAPGHTPGNVVIHASSRDEPAVFLGDVLHHQLQLAKPEWSTLSCSDPVLSRKTRLRLVEEHAERGTRLFPAHFPAPAVGRVVRHGIAYRYAFE